VTANQPQQRPPGFTYRDKKTRREGSHRELHADAAPLSRLAERFGTPLYVYSETTIRERYREFDRAFSGCEHTVCYSVKANSNLSILRVLARMGAGFDIVSGGELQRVLEAKGPALAKRRLERRTRKTPTLRLAEGWGTQGKAIVFSGVGKLAEEIDQALAAGILLFNVESASELKLLAARAGHHRKQARFAIRVNPHVAAETHPYISTGLHEHKFGVPWRDAPELYRQGGKESFLEPAGVSVHIGSQITEVGPFRETMQRIASLVESLRESGFDIRYVDAGGGLGIFYDRGSGFDFSSHAGRYAKSVMQPLKSLGVHLLLEPGRAIVAPAGVLITRVVYRKRNEGKRFLVVDAAMNDLIRPSLYSAYHEIVPVVAKAGRELETVDVVGPVCESGDFFARDRELAHMEEGELLAILDAGAYGMSLASNYNTRPRAAEALVSGKRVRLIRRRESVDDLLAAERIER
jgi:diaminopimelate decarboxylase